MALFGKNKEDKKKKSNWGLLKKQSFSEDSKNRDVHYTQNLERGDRGEVTKPVKEHIMAVVFTLLLTSIVALIAYIGWIAIGWFYDFKDHVAQGGTIVNFERGDARDLSWKYYALVGMVGMSIYYPIREKMLGGWRSKMALIDGSDINTYENDQHIMLHEELHENYDFFPNTGAHSSVQVSSMLSHSMISQKGLKSIEYTERHKKDKEVDGVVIYKGEPVRNPDGSLKQKTMPIIDEEFGQDLFTASGIPEDEKEMRIPIDVRSIPYNPVVSSEKVVDKKTGKKVTKVTRADRDKLDYDTVADLINDDWEFPDYEVQRPSGAYIVDTAPLNTMVLAITRAGKGQTIIEPTIDMWTREKRKNNIVVNDPKGELLVKFFVPATLRGYEIVQFNLINPLNTDIYNPLGFAAQAAREGNFTKAASYIENIGDIFFPKEGADDPMWPNAANNAFKRSAFGLIDFYLEEEKRLRQIAKKKGIPEKQLVQSLDDMWGKVTLYNAYQLFVVLSSKKSSDPEYIKIDEDEEVKEKDYLTLFFDATAKLPQNEMRKLVQNTDNALRAMAGSDKTIASVYGIALTAMSFFTDPTISTLTSGKPSQNFDSQGLSFPRRMGVRFASEYLERHNYVGLQSVWEAYEDPNFEKQLDPKLFGHTQIIDREGWARYFFDGKFKNRKSYIKLTIRHPRTNLLVKTFYFEAELTYKTDLSGRHYVKDPVMGKKIIRDGVLREMQYDRQKGCYDYADTMVERKYVDISVDQTTFKPEMVRVPAISQKTVQYTERPKAVFFITPPHLMHYAKLILILIKQMVDVNFEGSYLTKDTQKPLYKTRYMLDEVGNLQSEGKGIPALQTMLSIGLGQDQQFTLILQTLQQLRDVYGDSVDRVIQGNTENIVFLKSTDDAMIETLVKMSGTTHESRVDQKSLTKDNDKINGATDSKTTYTMSTRERPVIQFNDFMFIKERNSIILKAGTSPIWNRNETVLPMSWRLHMNQLSLPGPNSKFTLQTIPTNSSAKDFDVRKNQPDFFEMLNERLDQARIADQVRARYMKAYDYDETDFIRLDPNVVSDDIMNAIHAELASKDSDGQQSKEKKEGLLSSATDNTEVIEATHASQEQQNQYASRTYAHGAISAQDLVTFGSGQVNHQLDDVLARAYRESKQYFDNDGVYTVTPEGELKDASTGVLYIKSLHGANREDYESLQDGITDGESRVFGEDDQPVDPTNEGFEITDAFLKHLVGLPTWEGIASGRFESEVARAYQQLKGVS